MFTRDSQPSAGHQQEGLHRDVGALCSGGQQGRGSGSTIRHTRSLASGEDVQGWRRAQVAVPSGSSFPRNPLGATLGIPGNTVLEATARQLEMVHPMGSRSLWMSR